MNKKCIGCGAILQDDDINSAGYTEEEYSLCRRCFRLKYYNEYSFVVKDNTVIENIISNYISNDDLVLHLIDIMDIGNPFIKYERLNSNAILVITKRDILLKSLKDEILLERIKKTYPNYKDYILISSKKNYNMDILMELINKYKNGNKIYVVGNTNSGKSSLINKIVDDYSTSKSFLTVSNMPSTTIDIVEINVNEDLTIVDTPGIISNSNIFNFINKNEYKKVEIKKEIKPSTFQLYSNSYFFVEDMLKIKYESNKNNSITFFISNNLNIKKTLKDKPSNNDFVPYEFNLNKDEDIVIEGLGFIKIVNKCKFTIYSYEGLNIYKREKLI